MTGFSVGRGFSETFGFLKDNWLAMLLWLAVALLVLALLFGAMFGGNAAVLTGGSADPLDPAVILGFLGQLFLFALLAMVVLYGAGLMIWRLGLSRDGSTGDIGWALLAGLTFGLAMFVVMLVAYLAVILAIFALMAVFGLVGGGLGAFTDPMNAEMAGGMLGTIFLAYPVMMIALLWLHGRLMAAGPIMADGRLTNPFSAIAQSWRMSAPVHWRILGFLIVFTIVSYVIFFILAMIVIMVGTVVGGGSGMGEIATIIIMMIVYLPFLMLWISIPPGIYRALGGIDDSAEMFA